MKVYEGVVGLTVVALLMDLRKCNLVSFCNQESLGCFWLCVSKNPKQPVTGYLVRVSVL